jgi:death-on-curing family protein
VHSLAYHHLFADGNKRTAAEAVAVFLTRNGRTITWDAATAQAFMLEVAQGGLTVEQVAERLTQYVR